ncbi:aminoglycoside phosphotransferase family protein [Rapidithrix thailandica]|uniref:Aminoglycoside phosphotransferase family protein n=1 Tax=Rapidithrix thailandica TaxID=413964 RepID=A0AAW9S642_9BACT
MLSEARAIFDHFQIDGDIKQAVPFGNGHINDTLRLINQDPGKDDYLLQKINHHIFKQVPELMENIQRVTEHLQQKLKTIPGCDPKREVLTLIPTKTGGIYYQDAKGDYWRVFLFIPNHRSYDIVETPEQAYEGGKTFGKFQALLADLPGGPLHETIPNFHNMVTRLETFFRTLKKDPVNRAQSVAEEIEFVEDRVKEMCLLQELREKGELPERITHNDTKFNNVLLDENDKGLCVIDLDTVMPGLVHFDFGDAIRTSANTGAEDEADLSKVEMNITMFEAYAQGFLEQTQSALTPKEIELLPYSAKFMPFIMGLRFLTDYLDGDNYYKIKFPEHNLQRARAQFKLTYSAERQMEDMKNIIFKLH